MKNSLFVSAAIFFVVGTHSAFVSAAEKACVVTIDPAALRVGFTAFKTTEKLPVAGHFLKVDYQGKKTGTFAEVLNSARLSVDLLSVETENPARNATLVKGFFEKFKAPSQVKVSVSEWKGDSTHGTWLANIQVNGLKKKILMEYTVDAQGLTAHGTIDIVKDFHAQGAFDSLHELCKTLHQGKDGVSKTWSEVSLDVRVPVTSTCR